MKTQKAQFHIKRVKGNLYLYVEKFVWDSKLKRNRLVKSHYVGNAEKLFAEMEQRKQESSPPASQSFEFGKSAALISVAEELGLPDIFKEVFDEGWEKTYQLSLLMVLGRFNPGRRARSKLNTASWYWKESFLPFIWDLDATKNEKLFADALYNCMDLFTEERRARIWTELGKRLIQLGRRPTKLILDASNVSTWISEEHSKLARKGYAKDRRYDLNLIGFHVAIDDDGIPFMGDAHPGNKPEAELFKELVEEMGRRLSELNVKPEEVSIVIDTGNNSNEGFETAWKHGFHVIGKLKRNQQKHLMNVPLKKYKVVGKSSEGHVLRAYRASEIQYGRECTIVIVHNEGTAKKEQEDYRSAKRKFKELCIDLERRIHRKGRGKKLTPSAAYKELVKNVPPHYEGVFKGEVTKNGDFRWWIDETKEKEYKSGFGKQVIFTDLNGMKTEAIVKASYSRSAVEHEFSECKRLMVIPVAPIWHSEDRRIKVHVFLCLLGMLLYKYMMVKLSALKMSEQEILDELGRVRLGVGKVQGKLRFLLENYGGDAMQINKLIDIERQMPKS